MSTTTEYMITYGRTIPQRPISNRRTCKSREGVNLILADLKRDDWLIYSITEITIVRTVHDITAEFT